MPLRALNRTTTTKNWTQHNGKRRATEIHSSASRTTKEILPRARAPFPQSNRPPPSTVSQPDPASIVITIERYARGMLRYVPRTQPSKHDEYLCRMQVHNNKYEMILDG